MHQNRVSPGCLLCPQGDKLKNIFFLNVITDSIVSTLKCLSIGTPIIINFPFVPNGKFMGLGVPIFEHILIRLLCAQILGHLKIINFTFKTNENFIIFGCPNT